jgi:hypothetical protein
MDKLTPELIWYLFVFLVPGFVVASWVNLFVPLRPGSDNKNFLSYVLLTLVVYLPLLVWKGWHGEITHMQSFRQMIWQGFVFLLIIPLAIGWGISKFIHTPKAWGWVEKKLKVKVVHPVASAWDRAFQREDNPWLLVTLKDGRRLGGRWDADAVASSDPSERDLFLKDVYEVKANGEWSQNNVQSLGILLKADQIALVEFIQATTEEIA